MTDKEITRKVNLECSIKKKPLKKLKEILKLYDVNELEEFYYAITKEEIQLSKSKLIDKIYDELTDENVIHIFLKNIIKEEYDELDRIIKNKGQLQDDYIESRNISYLKNFGIVHSFNYKNRFQIIVPDEIMDIMNNMNMDMYYKESINNSKIIKLAYSMLNLYGAVPLDFFIDSYCKYYGYKDANEINFDCVFALGRFISVKLIETENNIYLIKEEDFDDCDKAIISKVITRIEDDLFEFDFKEISLDKLLNYEDLYYYEETHSVVEFKKYLGKNGMKYENIDLLVGAVVSTFRKDYNEGILFLNETIEEEGLILDDDNIDEIMGYVNNIISNISIWGNKGWTNKEIVLGKIYD